MTNPFSKLWLVFGLHIVTCFGLPVWSTNMPETDLISPCTTKLVVVDDDVRKDNELIIPYSICQVERPTCFVSNQLCDSKPIQEVETIKEAQFVDKNGKVNHIPHGSRHFNVSLKGEDFTIQSIYNYTVSYYYETICDDDIYIISPTSCYGWINMSLIIVVTDVRLTVVSDEVLTLESDSEEAMTQKRFQVEGAGIVDLECSLGLAEHNINMQLEFVFTPADSNATKTVLCSSESIQRVDNWVVTPNMNNNTCHLKIMNFSKADGGQYDCLMVLNNSHTLYNQDRSNAIFLAVENPKNQHRKLLYYVMPSLIAVIVILCSAILVTFVIVKIRKKHRPHPYVPAPVMVGPIAHECGYGSTGSTHEVQCHRATSGEIVDPGQDTPYPTEAESETSFSGYDTDSKPTTPLLTTDSPRPTSSSDENDRKLNAPHKQPSSSKRSRPRSSQRRSLSARSRCRRSSHPRSSRIRRQTDTGVMSEIIGHDSSIAMEYRNGISTRIAPSTSLDFYSSLLVGFKVEDPHDTHCGSRPDGSQPNLTDISQTRPQQDQAEAGGAVPAVMYRRIPSDTTSSTGPATSASSGPGATSESSSGPSSSDLSAGEASPQSHCRLEQRGDSCCCGDNEADNNNSSN